MEIEEKEGEGVSDGGGGGGDREREQPWIVNCLTYLMCYNGQSWIV